MKVEHQFYDGYLDAGQTMKSQICLPIFHFEAVAVHMKVPIIYIQ